MAKSNAHIVLKYNIGPNETPTEDIFGYEECPYPDHVGDGQVLVKNLYLSVDPTLRFAMNFENIPPHLVPWKPGKVVHGILGLGVVVESKSQQLAKGDIVMPVHKWPWVMFFVEEGEELHKMNPKQSGGRLTPFLGIFGSSGLTPYFAIRDKGHIVRGANQTFVVSGAAGSCGIIAGQIARLDGVGKVVGICGSDEKCRYLTDVLKLDAAVNYKSEDVERAIRKVCPNGVDIYFDNVGGEISRVVIEQMNVNGHVILCGQIAEYNRGVTLPFPVPPEIKQVLMDKNLTRDVFLLFDYKDKFINATTELAKWVMEGKLTLPECIEEGLANAGKAYVKMMRGDNIGKQLVHISDP